MGQHLHPLTTTKPEREVSIMAMQDTTTTTIVDDEAFERARLDSLLTGCTAVPSPIPSKKITATEGA